MGNVSAWYQILASRFVLYWQSEYESLPLGSTTDFLAELERISLPICISIISYYIVEVTL